MCDPTGAREYQNHFESLKRLLSLGQPFLIIYFSRFYQISSGLEITFQHLHHSITPIRIKRDRQMSKDRFRSTRATIIPMRMAVFQKSIRNKRL